MSSSKKVLDEKSIRICNNLKILRKQKGESQTALAQRLNVTKDLISKIERGERTLLPEYIPKIAEHYGVTVDMFENDNLTKEFLDEYESKVNVFELLEPAYKILFQFKRDNVQEKQDVHFIKAEEFFSRIVSGDFMGKMVSSCRNHYYESFKESKALSSAANTLMMLIFEYLRVDFSDDFVKKSINEEITTKELYLYFKENTQKMTPAKKAFIEATEEIYNNCLIGLRKNKEERDLAEYYLCLKYIFAMLNNDLDYMENALIGFVMMAELLKLENPYAKAFWDEISLFDN